MGQVILENLKITYVMVVEFIYTQTEESMKVNGKTIKKKDRVFQR